MLLFIKKLGAPTKLKLKTDCYIQTKKLSIPPGDGIIYTPEDSVIN